MLPTDVVTVVCMGLQLAQRYNVRRPSVLLLLLLLLLLSLLFYAYISLPRCVERALFI